jgi:tetratricopeptide (TPR) repeat protein
LVNFSASEVKSLFVIRLAYFLFLLALYFLCVRFRVERIMAPISAGIALVVFSYGIIQKLVLFPLALGQIGPGSSFYTQATRIRLASGRIFAIFPLPTLYAMVCGVLLIFITHYLYHSRGLLRVFWAVLLLLGGCNLVLTESFGGILFFTAGILFYLFVSRIFKIKYLAPLIMVLALVFFVVIALRFSEAQELAPAKLRFANWQQAGRVIASAPLLGVGLGNYEAAVPPQVLPGEPTSIYAHNFFLQLAAEAGLPLFILLVVLCWPFLKKSLGGLLRPENALFASACILILFFNLFDVGNYFFAAGVCFAVALSQVAPLEGPARLRHFAAVALLAALLLANETGISRQRSGDLWLSRQDPARAEILYRSALKIAPFSYRSWLGLAHIAWERQDLPRTEAYAQRVLRLYPHQPYANYLLSLAAWHRGAYWTALVRAGQASVANRKNMNYQRWHETVQGTLARQFSLPGN